MDKAEVPPGWIYATIGDVVASDGIFTDGDWVETKDQDPNGGIRLIQLADIGDGRFLNKSSRFLTRAIANDLKCTFLTKGDLLVARMPDPLGRCCIFPLDGDEKYVTVVDVCAVRLGTSPIDPKYMMYLINSSRTRADIEALKSGSTRKRISRGKFASIKMLLAPQNEQNRIVAKIEELFSELDKGVESLNAARAQLKVYRQAVLKHAFEGKLTAQWREENKDQLEKPEQLLARIMQEREAQYERQLEEWKAAVKTWEESGEPGKKPAKPRPLSLPEPLTDTELTVLPEISSRWRWAKVGELFSVHVGATPSRKNQRYWNGEINWISSGEVCFAPINSTSETITNEGLANTSTEVHPIGTVVLGMIGEGKTRGQAAITNIEACHNQNTAAIRVSESDIQPEYVYYYLLYRYEHTRRVGSGNNQKALNKERVSNLPIPLASLDEQAVLVQALEKHLLVIAQLDNEFSSQIASANSLRQSILQKGFAGQLVAQDPNDEPASVLLDKIKAEKEQASKSREITKRSSKKRAVV